MPPISPTGSNVRGYVGTTSSNINSPTTQFSPRQLADKASNELRVDSNQPIAGLTNPAASTSTFPAHPANTFTTTTERFLQQTGNALEQLKALAIRSASDNTSAETRETLNEEAKVLVSLIDDIANTAALDGQNLLDGSIERISFQLSFTEPTQKSIQGFDARSASLGIHPGFKQSTGDRIQLQNSVIGNQGVQEGNARTNIISDFSILVEGHNINETINIADQRLGALLKNIARTRSLTDSTHKDFGSGGAKQLAARINTLRESGTPSLRNIFASATTTFGAGDVSNGDFSGTVNRSTNINIGSGSIDRGDLAINGINVDRVTFLKKDTAGTLIHAINAISALTGVKATTDIVTGELTLEAVDGRDIIINTTTAETNNLIFGGGQSRFSQGFADLRISGRVTLSANNNLSFFGSSKSLTGFDDFSLDSTLDNQFTSNTIADTNLKTSADSENALNNINQAMKQLRTFNNKLSNLHAEFESSLTKFGSIYQQPRENSTPSFGNTIDRTTASQFANFSKKLMQQSIDTAIQAQANASPSTVLFFLR
ncbi:MAG: hypothetical protein COA99_00215 [Moraxellaceae bacterium]|nr:MAG: hypothetical protein COA99_00215 [Moraxellaceae bacterium]